MVIMKELPKLVITATTANSWIYPEIKNWALTTDQLVESAIKCAEAGAAVLHIHLPPGEEVDVVKRVRERTDAIIQCGMSSFPIEKRNAHFECHPDMLSIILNHHDEHFTSGNVNQLHSLEELEQYCTKCKRYKIKPEWEVWHMGSYWNLQYLFDKKLLEPIQVLTLFFNWPGGTWSPPTHDELLHRVKYIPQGCVYAVSTMGKEQMSLAALTISIGGNIRIGTEDWPFIEEGKPAKDNAQLIEKFVKIAKEMGRDVADPSEARNLMGFTKK
jgi:3-keto-5-aminohexanoate cleavage enzyme